MYNLIELQDALKGLQDEQVKNLLGGDPRVPDFMILGELKRRDDDKKDVAMRKAQNQTTVAEDVVASAGMPIQESSQMAMAMSPKSDIAGNTGVDQGLMAMKQMADLPSEEDEIDIMEEPIRASSGGFMQFGRPMMGVPRLAEKIAGSPFLSSPLEDYPPSNHIQQSQIARQGYGGGLGGFGRDIMGRVSERSRGDVDNFLGEVEGMAEDRFDIELGQQQRGMSGKGQVPRMMPYDDPRMIRAMNEGGVVNMFGGGLNQFKDYGGNFIPKVKPRPPSSSIYVDKGTVINEQAEWDKNEGKFYNIDGTLKDEFKNTTGSPATNTGGQPDSMRDAQRMIDINEIPESPEKKDEETPPPGTDDPAPRNYLSDLTASLDKFRQEAKESADKDKYLALMQSGLKLAQRGQLDDVGEGIKTLSASDKAYRDRMAQMQGLEAKIAIAGANIDQKDRAVQAAITKAANKTGLSAKDALARYTKLSTDIITLKTKLRTEDVSMDDAERASLMAELKEMEEVRDILQGQAKGLMGDNILDTDLTDMLKELYKTTSPTKEDK
jgi:hypothetical protein